LGGLSAAGPIARCTQWGIATSARDAARWLILNMNGGEIDGTRIVSKKLADEMLTQQAAQRARPCAHRNRLRPGLAVQPIAIEHPTACMAAVRRRCLLRLPTERNVGIAVLVNTDRGGGAICDIVSIDVSIDSSTLKMFRTSCPVTRNRRKCERTQDSSRQA
jgi:CubicO group peptidase (beta-lactamase class C family)